jgi:hypothetical protein
VARRLKFSKRSLCLISSFLKVRQTLTNSILYFSRAMCTCEDTIIYFQLIAPFVGQQKVHPRTVLESPEGKERYSSTLSLISALDGYGCSRLRLGRFTPGKETRNPLYRRLVGPQAWFEQMWKISTPPGFDARTVQPVARRYTDRAINALR